MEIVTPPLIDLSDSQFPLPTLAPNSFPLLSAPPFQPYIPILPQRYTLGQASSISSTIDIAIRLIQANQIALHRVASRLDETETILQSSIGHLTKQAIRNTQESRLILRKLSENMARTLKRPPFVHPRAIPTSAIANAKDEDLPFNSSSSFSRHTEATTIPSSPINEAHVPTTALTPATPPKARFSRLDSPLVLAQSVAAKPAAGDYFDDPDIVAHPAGIAETSVLLATPSPKKRPLQAVISGEEAKGSVTKRLRASPVPADIPAPILPAPPEAATPQPLDKVSVSVQRRRSTRTKISPDKALTTALISAPSSFPQTARSTKRIGRNKENSQNSILRRKPTTSIPKRNEAIQLKMGLGVTRAQGAVWPKKKANTLRGAAVSCIVAQVLDRTR